MGERAGLDFTGSLALQGVEADLAGLLFHYGKSGLGKQRNRQKNKHRAQSQK